MTEDIWKKLDRLYHAALECDPAKRDKFVGEACAGDAELQRQLIELLAYDAQAQGFIERSALEIAARKLAFESVKDDLAVPGQIGHYELRELLGEGGMGKVYLALDTRLGRKVTIKLLPSAFTTDGERLHRFEQEARLASGLNHPNIITIHEVGQTTTEANVKHFIVMEYVDGETLRARMTNSPLKRVSLSQTLNIALQIADALSAAHQAGIVHRDIKPENIMLRRDGYAKVLDFGLAKLAELQEVQAAIGPSAHNASRTSQGMVLGTVNYMSPEQAGASEVDARTDLFSLGAVIYEMVTGSLPFIGETPSGVISAIQTKEPAPLSQFDHTVPLEWQRVVCKALSKNREDRYQSAQALALDLNRLKPDPSPPSSAGATTSAVSGHRRSNWRVGGGLFVMVVLLAWVALSRHDVRQWFTAGARTLPSSGLDIRKLHVTSNLIGAHSLSHDGSLAAYVVLNSGGILVNELATGSNRLVARLGQGVTCWGMRFSPDGNSLYYVIENLNHRMGGILYRVSVSGGMPQRLLTGINGSAVLSPDGSRMVFKYADQNRAKQFLKLANADGTEVREFDSSDSFNDYWSYDWSPSGKSIVYVNSNQGRADRYWRIVEKPVNGSPATVWSERQSRQITDLVSLPEGRGLLMISEDPNTRLPQVWYLSQPGGTPQRVTNDTNKYQDIAVADDGRLLLANTVDRPARVLVVPLANPAHPQQITPDYDDYDTLAWTPGGELLCSFEGTGESNLWTMNADGGGRRHLTNDAFIDLQPAVSPDGGSIVFISDRDGTSNLWRIDSNGSHPMKLSQEESAHPRVSADGQWVFYAAKVKGNWSLWRVPITGGEPTEVIGQTSNCPAISPDGRLLAHTFLDEQLNRWRIAVRPLEGGAPIKTFDAEIGYDSLHWMHDGRGIAYIKGKNEIVAQALAGGSPRLLLKASDDWLFSFDFSSDGQELAYLSGRIVTDLILIRNFVAVDARK